METIETYKMKQQYSRPRIPSDTYAILKQEAEDRNITVNQYIKLLLDTIKYTYNLFRELDTKTDDLKKFYEDHKGSFYDYLWAVRGINNETISNYTGRLDSRLIPIRTVEDLVMLDTIIADGNFNKGIKNIFSYMEYLGMHEFNGISITVWKDSIRTRRTKQEVIRI